MANVSVSGEPLSGHCPFFYGGGLLTSGYMKASGVPASRMAYQKITGTAHTSAVTTAAHSLGTTPSIIIPVSRTSGVGVQTTGTHTSTHIMGIVADANDTSFEVYVFA